MKKIFHSVLFFAVFFIFSTFSYAEIVSFFTPQKKWGVTTGLSLENGADFAPLTSAVDLSVDLNMREICANAGIFVQPSQVDFSTEAVFWPTFFNCFNAGVGSVLHFVHCNDIFVEFDYLSGVYLSYHTPKKFDCMLNFLYHEKNSRIFAIKDDVPWLKNRSIAFKTEFNFRPISQLNLNLTISSYSMYRYMLWFAPDFSFSADYKFFDMFAVGGQVEIQYIDMFTLSSNLNSIDLRIYGRIEF